MKKKKKKLPNVFIDVPDDITLDQLFQALIILSKDGKPPRFEFTEEEQGLRGGWDIYTEAIDDCIRIIKKHAYGTLNDDYLEMLIADLEQLKHDYEL